MSGSRGVEAVLHYGELHRHGGGARKDTLARTTAVVSFTVTCEVEYLNLMLMNADKKVAVRRFVVIDLVVVWVYSVWVAGIYVGET